MSLKELEKKVNMYKQTMVPVPEIDMIKYGEALGVCNFGMSPTKPVPTKAPNPVSHRYLGSFELNKSGSVKNLIESIHSNSLNVPIDEVHYSIGADCVRLYRIRTTLAQLVDDHLWALKQFVDDRNKYNYAVATNNKAMNRIRKEMLDSVGIYSFVDLIRIVMDLKLPKQFTATLFEDIANRVILLGAT